MSRHTRTGTALVIAATVIVGLALAALAQMLALGLAGAGHGWVTPFFISGVLWLAWPLVLVRAGLGRSRTRIARAADWVTVIGPLGADLSLWLMTQDEDVRYARQAFAVDDGLPITLTWLLLWCSWQPIAAARLLRRVGP